MSDSITHETRNPIEKLTMHLSITQLCFSYCALPDIALRGTCKPREIQQAAHTGSCRAIKTKHPSQRTSKQICLPLIIDTPGVRFPHKQHFQVTSSFRKHDFDVVRCDTTAAKNKKTYCRRWGFQLAKKPTVAWCIQQFNRFALKLK